MNNYAMLLSSFFLSLFIYFERDRDGEQRPHEQGRGRERGRIPSRLCSTSAESDVELELTKL